MHVSVRDLKNSLSEHLARVRRGERLTVTLRGRPIAQITPADTDAALSVDERLRRMAEAGDLILRDRSARAPDDFEPIILRRAPSKRGSARSRALTASAVILEDRG